MANPITEFLNVLGAGLEKLPRAMRAAGFAVLAVVVVVAIVVSGEAAPHLAVTLVLIVSAIAAMMMLHSRTGYMSGATFLVAGIVVWWLGDRPPEGPTVEPTGQTAWDTAFGVVKYLGTAMPVADARISIDGHGNGGTYTDVDGNFTITFPTYILTNDTLTLTVRKDSSAADFQRPREPLPLRLAFPRTTTIARRQTPGPFVLAQSPSGKIVQRWAPPLPTKTGEFRIVLDSIVAIEDGTPGDATWRFDMTVDTATLVVSDYSYNDDEGENVTYIGGETRLANPGDTLRLQLRGVRKRFFGHRHIASTAVLPVADLVVDSARTYSIRLVGNKPAAGDFHFYITALRVDPLPAQKSGQDRPPLI